MNSVAPGARGAVEQGLSRFSAGSRPGPLMNSAGRASAATERDATNRAANPFGDRPLPARAAPCTGSRQPSQSGSPSSRAFCISIFLAIIVLVSLLDAGAAHAAVIANWENSARSWNNPQMSKIKTAMQDAGHRVDADAAISGTALLASGVLVVGEPTAAPSAAELALLREFVMGGGMVFVFGDTGIDLPTYNNLLAGIGSTMSFAPTTISTSGPLAVVPFTQSPWKISGGSLSVSPGNATAGGTLIDSNYVRFEQIGNGYVVVFGDRIDHNGVISDTNTKLLLNLVSFAFAPPLQVPAVSATGLLLLSLLVACLGALHVRRRRRFAGAA